MPSCVNSLNVVSTESNIDEVRDVQNRSMITSDTEVFVDHACDLPSS